jgi:hypothetical protein
VNRVTSGFPEEAANTDVEQHTSKASHTVPIGRQQRKGSGASRYLPVAVVLGLALIGAAVWATGQIGAAQADAQVVTAINSPTDSLRHEWKKLPAPYNRSVAELNDMLKYDTPHGGDTFARTLFLRNEWKKLPAPYNRSVAELNDMLKYDSKKNEVGERRSRR